MPVVLIAVPIRHPFLYVPKHVIQLERVRLLPSHFVSLAVTITAIPGDLIQVAIARGRGTRASSIFPLGFRRQPHTHSRAVLQCVIPGHLLHGQAGAFENSSDCYR